MANQVEIKQLLGALNLDDPIRVLGKGFHTDARGIVWEGIPPNRSARVVNGNSSVTNSLLPSTGVNKTIARVYDPINKRIFFWNYNSSGKHGIYCYNTIPATFQRLIEVGVNTVGDPLQFNGESFVTHDLIYGDSAQGDILYFVDSLFRPTKININRALSGGYGNIQRSFLDVAKEPSDIPPYVVYENDPSNTVNNCRKKLFRIKIRYEFDDKDKSVTSTQSQMPVPLNAFDQSIDADPTKNCRLAIVYQTGASNVKKIDILVSNSLGNVMSDWYLVESIDKAAAGIPDNDVATYLFYNDKGYNNIDVQESNQLYDYVPIQTKAQSLLNGSVLAYGNITEGYPNLTNFSDGANTSSISNSAVQYYYGNYFIGFIANQGGLTGFGTGQIHIAVRGIIGEVVSPFDVFTVYFTDGSNITYTATTGDDSAAIIEGLRVNAISNGFTVISAGANDLYIIKTGISLARWIVTNANYSFNALLNGSYNAYDWNSHYGFGIVYFDQKGRTNGVVYTSGFSVQTNSYTEGSVTGDITKLNASIYHQPPDWAYTWQWVRTNNLSKQKYVQWVTDRTYKDLVVISGAVKYAYLSIESLRLFGVNNPGSPLGYGFSAGDRVRFFKRYNPDGSTANLYGNTKDFEVLASLINPTINGAVKEGQFIKIILPTTDGTFDFGVSGFDNYFIELYTPAQPVANNLNVYFEFGERYAVGDPTLSTRFHQGELQNQIYLTQPATFELFKGDGYVKLRSIQTGNIFTWNVPSVGGHGFRFLIPMNFVGSTYTDSNITAHDVPFAGVGHTFDPTTDSRWALQVGANATTFKVGGSISINFPTARAGDSWQIYAVDKSNDHYVLVGGPFDASNAGTYTFPITTVYFNGSISDSITLESDNLFFVLECINSDSDREMKFLSSNITMTVDHVINQRCIDPNFSDYFPSAVNSNGRAFIFDENANQVTYPVMYRWSLAYQTNTNINQTSRFYATNFDEVDRSKGAIQKLGILDRELIFFQERKIGHTGIYQKFITSTGSSNQLITTDSIITSNNVQYYQGDVGVGNQPTSVVQSDFVFYGVDPIKNIIWRLSRDGITDLTELYKVKTWAFQNIPKYLNPGNYPFGGVQKILGTYNIRQDNVGEYLLLAQGTSTPGETFAFEERYNSFTSKYDVDCDCIICAENVMYYFKNGVMWKQNNLSSGYNVFFGTQYTAQLLIPFNDQMTVKKVFMGLAYQAASPWNSNTAGDIETDTVSPQTNLKQQSRIMVQDYTALEAPNMYAAFNRNYNSMANTAVALWEGEYLNGHYILVRLRHPSNGGNYIFAPYVLWKPDPRNY